MFNSFLSSHKMLNKDGLNELTEQDFQNDNVFLLEMIDIYKSKPTYPKDRLTLSLVSGEFGILPRYTFLDTLNEKSKPNFYLDKDENPRIISYLFRYPVPALEKNKNTIKSDPEYFTLQFQLYVSKEGSNDIPANFEYMDNKGHSDNFLGQCSFKVMEDVFQIPATVTTDKKISNDILSNSIVFPVIQLTNKRF